MNRRFELVKKATDAAEAADGHLSPRYRYQRAAEAVVDALLPQVTTVEELEALPNGTVLVDGSGFPYWLSAGDDVLRSVLFERCPLTIVWQP